MGCSSSQPIDPSTGRPTCSATVRRRLLVFVRRPNTDRRGRLVQGTSYQLEADLEFGLRETLAGYKVLRPLGCSLELASAVGAKMKGHEFSNWSVT